jgi:mannose/cellobiose epimerase-like protein (N-acyl-D-glucosamine 2-epimerase family)
MTGNPERGGSSKWSDLDVHRQWLMQNAAALFDFFQPNFIARDAGFYALDTQGQPLDPQSQVFPIHIAARAVYCYGLGHLMGRPGSLRVVDHGLHFICDHHLDKKNGGYFWSVKDGPADASKLAYGHAFVLLAASMARILGHPLADALFSDITSIIDQRFWDDPYGVSKEEFTSDWVPLNGGSYRGQNSNMHLTEAMMAAFEATGESIFLRRAKSIAERIINQAARAVDWRVAEHFHADWTIDKHYKDANQIFRPAGTTPGHAFEWSRLLLQLWTLDQKREAWMPLAARNLFANAMHSGWDTANGGLFYALDWNNVPAIRKKLWWPLCEAAAAAHFLGFHFPSAQYEDSYRKIWDVIATSFIDLRWGGWHEEMDEGLQPTHEFFPGKQDIYHALQACLIPLYPATGSLAKVIPA